MKSSDWQDMATAPKNPYGEFCGPVILIWCDADGQPWPAHWAMGTSGDGCWCIVNDHAAKPEHNEILESDAVAWMPIAVPWQVIDRKAAT